MPTITIPDTIDIAIGRNARYGLLKAEAARFPDHVQAFIYEYGLRQILNDAASDKKAEDGTMLPEAEVRALSEKKLDNLYAGTLRVSGTRTPADPVAAEADKLARAALATAFRDKGWWKVIGKTEGESNLECVIRNRLTFLRKPAAPDDIQTFIDNAANAEAIQAEAKRKVAARAQAAATVNLKDLMG